MITTTASKIITTTASKMITSTASKIITTIASKMITTTSSEIITTTASKMITSTASKIITTTASEIITTTASKMITTTASEIITPTANCDGPEAQENDNVSYLNTIEGSIPNFCRDEGFVEVTGSNNQTSLANGTWSLPDPVCEADVTSQCNNLQTCYQCGVECSGNVLFGVNQSECIAYIDEITTFVVEYHPSEAKCVLGSCSGIDYKSPHSYGDVRAFRYTCTTECLTFSLKQDYFQKIENTTSASINVPRAQCIEMCLDTEYCYMWEHDYITCFFYLDCGSSLSCSKTLTLNIGHRLYTRICLESCDDPETPENGNVFYLDTIEGSTANFSCDDGFVEITGSNNQTCLANGTWSLPDPVCEANETTTSTTTSTTTTTTTTITAATSFTSAPTTSTIATTITTTLSPSTSSSQVTTDSPTPTTSTDSTTSSSTTTKAMTLSTSTSQITSMEGKSATSIKTAAKIYVIPCICYENKTFTGMTNEEIIEILIKEIKIDMKSTSLAKNKLMCREDNRPTSRVIGYVGLCFLIIAFGFIIVSDAYILVAKIKGAIGHFSLNSD